MSEEQIIGTSMKDMVAALTADYTKEIGDLVDSKVPPILDNQTYAARTSALVIALTRSLARAAAAFGEAQNQDSDAVGGLILQLFTKTHIDVLQTIEATREVEKVKLN